MFVRSEERLYLKTHTKSQTSAATVFLRYMILLLEEVGLATYYGAAMTREILPLPNSFRTASITTAAEKGYVTSLICFVLS